MNECLGKKSQRCQDLTSLTHVFSCECKAVYAAGMVEGL